MVWHVSAYVQIVRCGERRKRQPSRSAIGKDHDADDSWWNGGNAVANLLACKRRLRLSRRIDGPVERSRSFLCADAHDHAERSGHPAEVSCWRSIPAEAHNESVCTNQSKCRRDIGSRKSSWIPDPIGTRSGYSSAWLPSRHVHRHVASGGERSRSWH